MDKKTCAKCHEQKPINSFSKDRSRKDGMTLECKECRAIYQRSYRVANKETLSNDYKGWREKNKSARSAYNKAWRIANPKAVKRNANNRRARENGASEKISKGLENKLFDLQKGKCPCCGLPLGDDYHMDHILPLYLGGSNTDDNIQLMRAGCNFSKGSKHPIDFMQSRGLLC